MTLVATGANSSGAFASHCLTPQIANATTSASTPFADPVADAIAGVASASPVRALANAIAADRQRRLELRRRDMG